MISHDEAVNIWLGAFGTAAFVGGLLSGHWWWPSRQRLDDEWDDGHGAGRDEGYWAGYSIGVDDEARGLAWMYDEHGENLPPDSRHVPGNLARPAGPSPAAGRAGCHWSDCRDAGRCDYDGHQCQVNGPAGPPVGRTYSELVMLAAQDTPGPLDDALTAPVDPGWFPSALRRSEDWLEACRAELGLVAS